MQEEQVVLARSTGRGYVIPAGPVSLVMVIAAKGMVGCGAFDVAALDTFGFPAAKVRPGEGPSIASVADLLAGIVKEANAAARALGVEAGMTGKEALDRFS